MSRTNVPNFGIVNCTEVEVDKNGKVLPRDLNQTKYYGNNLQMEMAIQQGDIVAVDFTEYKKYKCENTTIIIDSEGVLLEGDLSKLSKKELNEIARENPEILKVIGKDEAR